MSREVPIADSETSLRSSRNSQEAKSFITDLSIFALVLLSADSADLTLQVQQRDCNFDVFGVTCASGFEEDGSNPHLIARKDGTILGGVEGLGQCAFSNRCAPEIPANCLAAPGRTGTVGLREVLDRLLAGKFQSASGSGAPRSNDRRGLRIFLMPFFFTR